MSTDLSLPSDARVTSLPRSIRSPTKQNSRGQSRLSFLPQSCDLHLLLLFKVTTSLGWVRLSMASILRRSSIRAGSSTDLGTIPHRSGISFQAWRKFTADPSLSNSITSRCVEKLWPCHWCQVTDCFYEAMLGWMVGASAINRHSRKPLCFIGRLSFFARDSTLIFARLFANCPFISFCNLRREVVSFHGSPCILGADFPVSRAIYHPSNNRATMNAS